MDSVRRRMAIATRSATLAGPAATTSFTETLWHQSCTDRIRTRGPRAEHRSFRNSGARDPARALQQPIESLKNRSYPQ
jgi:hypothetical protein